ncbi:Alcohol dehydrogenase superfamily zinc-type [Penicillium cinerascens]|uniref:Alcohol dehydrogenase superfamily zinc-type n=1 Tax=Penicillium cinerascens TaxID=70096 RepID=A0A9W9JD75_9EURO|nr:Alcohol dehydrogenase superfamily zinc-type [Penicillium cinerascens]KAJ5194893.1 Alcohol dehydrogenase superfamily zinc-type [Penicillium cinerascens]
MVVSKAVIAREPTHPLAVNWSLEDVDVHAPGDGEVLVEMRASGICHTDILLTSVSLLIRFFFFFLTFIFNVALAKSELGAGIVRDVGKNVHAVAVGDPVLLSFHSCSSCEQCKDCHPAYCDEFGQENYVGRKRSMSLRKNGEIIWTRFFGQSSFAQYSIVSEASVVNAKELLHHDHELELFAPLGCGFQTGMGAIQNIAAAGIAETVMIIGMGAVGMGALMTAKIRNCKAIIAVDRIKDRLELAKTLGASHILNTSDPSFTTLNEATRNLSAGGVSVVIDTTGVPTLIEQGIQSTTARVGPRDLGMH